MSRYTYKEEDEFGPYYDETVYRPRYRRVNIGWLDAPHPFEHGPVLPWFPDALLAIIAGPQINKSRGFHDCSFCSKADLSHYDPLFGTSEIRVPAHPGTMFAAPTLIWHYVTVHRYCPPPAFVTAVRNYDSGWMTEPSRWIPGDAERGNVGRQRMEALVAASRRPLLGIKWLPLRKSPFD